MSESGSTPPTSETNPVEGSVGDGAGAGGSAPADAFAAEREQYEARVRDWQGKHDRLFSKIEELERKLATAKPTESRSSEDSGLTLEALRAEMRREREITRAADALRSEYPHADPKLFNALDSFDTVEQFQVAVENSHQSFVSRLGPAVEAEKAKLMEAFASKYGPLDDAPTSTGDTGVGGLPTFEEVRRMTLAEREKLEREHPGLIERLLTDQLTRL